MTDTPDISKGQSGFTQAALFGCCPRCGARSVFNGPHGRRLLQFAPRCDACGLDISAFNVGDGPAAFLTLIIGAIIVALALWLQLSVEPPWWVHVMLWLPLTVGGVIGGLRVAKAALLWSEYRQRAGEVPPATTSPIRTNPHEDT